MTVPPPTSAGDEQFVVVIGDALIDEIHGDGVITEFVGGAALNVAVGLAILGVRTTLIAMVGDDTDGDRIRAFLDEHGVQLIATVGPNGSSRGVSNRVNGEPRYEFNVAARARRIRFGTAELEAISTASLVVVSCFPFDDATQSAELVGAIEDADQRLIIDPNPREGMLADTRAFCDEFEALARKALLVKVGDDDSNLLYGSSLGDLESRLLALGCRTVLGTAGGDGAEVLTSRGVTAHEPIATLAGPIVDTMGAGDAVLASITRSILRDGIPIDAESWRGVLHRAMAIAAATCRREGALLRLP